MKAKQFARYVSRQYLVVDKNKGKTTNLLRDLDLVVILVNYILATINL